MDCEVGSMFLRGARQVNRFVHRSTRLHKANDDSIFQAAYEAFLWLLETYEFPLQDGQTYGGSTAIPLDPAGRRDAKIKQYKMEKALKEKVSVSTKDYVLT